jgi:hypothetical protein
MTTASDCAAADVIASRISRADVTRTTSAPAGSSRATFADTTVTFAPRAAAVLASA